MAFDRAERIISDQRVPDWQGRLKEIEKTFRVEHEIVRYPGAQHGFNCDQRPSYNPGAAADAWPRALAWFDAHLS